jgi:lipoyl(octanoyl) transferase
MRLRHEVPRVTERALDVRRLGRISYAEGLTLQQGLVEERRAERIPDTLLLLEHPHVLTLGVKLASAREHVLATAGELAARGVELHETGRGGDVTYHGPGQLVGYPILDLRPDRCDVHRYVRDLEEVMIRVSADYGLEATRSAGQSGAWIGDEKIGAVGVRISRWITSHGFAFNVNTDLGFFTLIVPCGIADRGVTSLSARLGRTIETAEVEASFIAHFGAVFDRRVLEPESARHGRRRDTRLSASGNNRSRPRVLQEKNMRSGGCAQTRRNTNSSNG